MTSAEAYLSDVVIVARDGSSAGLEQLASRLSEHGLEVRDLRPDVGVIEGTCDHSLVRKFDEFPGVSYVRTVFNYIADYPAGHPLDRSAGNI